MCQICAIAQHYQSPQDGSRFLSQGILTRTVQLKPRPSAPTQVADLNSMATDMIKE